MFKEISKHWHTKEWVLLIASMFFSLALVAIIGPDFFKASFLPDDWDDPLDAASGIVRPPEGTGEYMVRNLITKNIIPLFKYIFVAVSILFFSLSVFIIVTSGGDEEKVSKYRNSMLWALIGFALISLSAEIATALDPAANSGIDVAATKAKPILQKMVSYLQLAMGIIAVAFTFYAGFRFISAGDDEDAINNAKKHFLWGFSGLIISILANPLVNKVFYPTDQTPGAEEIKAFNFEIIGVLRFLLSFLALLAFIGLVVAGGLYVTSMGDDDRQNRAKQIIVGSAIGLILISISYALVAVFIPS